jgi:hypothetical protein
MKLFANRPATVGINPDKHLSDARMTNPRLNFDLDAVAEHFFVDVER